MFIIYDYWACFLDEWMNEWMNDRMDEWIKEWMNENKCGKAWKVIGIKKYVRISRFEYFKCLRDWLTDQPTDGQDLL